MVSIKHTHIYDMNQSIDFVGAFSTQRYAALRRLGCSGKCARVVRLFPGSNVPCQSPDMVSNIQGCRVKKTINSDRICLTSWNIGSLTGRLT
jgi:hypothetical protein